MVTFRIISIKVFLLTQRTRRRHKLICPYLRERSQREYARILREGK
jgi:hypothetical protein